MATRRCFLGTTFAAWAARGFAIPPVTALALDLENEWLRFAVDTTGRVREFSDRRTGRSYLAPGSTLGANSFLTIRRNGQLHAPTRCQRVGDAIRTEFAAAGAVAWSRVAARRHYLIFELLSLEGKDIEEIGVCQLAVTMRDHVGTMAGCAWNAQFAAAIRALDLRTNAGVESGPSPQLWGKAFSRVGIGHARIALIGCPPSELRSCLKELTRQEGLPHSAVGGAWALEAPETRYSYLFSFAGEEDIDEWLKLARQAGTRELLLSEIGPYGHYEPYPARFPHGLAGVRDTVAKIHAAGLIAGWHMLAFTIQKTDSWVTPTPDPRLAVRTTLTLAENLSSGATSVMTRESPAALPREAGFWFRGGRDILVDEEILSYADYSTSAPYRLTGCQRGSYGTRAAAHAAGTPVRNLQEVFGTYLPAADSTLFTEMQERVAEIVNYCKFDKIYMDGLDGADAFAGSEWAWHYGPKFALGVHARAQRRLQFEASAWFHHDWPITSRLGAWDYPRRDPQRFVDLHVAANQRLDDLLPTQLGWWTFSKGEGRLNPATTAGDIAYLGAKCLGNGMALSLEQLTPQDVASQPTWPGLLEILQAFEQLRLAGEVSETAKERLRQAGIGFSVRRTGAGKTEFLPFQEQTWRLEISPAQPSPSLRWQQTGTPQAPTIRLRMQLSIGSAGDAEAQVLEDFSRLAAFDQRGAAAGVRGELQPANSASHGRGAVFTAENRRRRSRGAWLHAGRIYTPARDLSQAPALGLWVHGDGQGELLNLQLADVRGTSIAIGEHYIVIDFIGWRHFRLLETAAHRWSDFEWPYDNALAVYRESIDNAQVAQLNLYFNNIPARGSARCGLSAIHALPTKRASLVRPRLTMRGQSVEIPAEIPSGSYIEISPSGTCTVFGEHGEALRRVAPQGSLPPPTEGENEIALGGEIHGAETGSVELTLISGGKPFLAH